MNRDADGKGRGGSYPNHPAMKYELPLPYAPLGPPSDEYRARWDHAFERCDPTTCPVCLEERP